VSIADLTYRALTRIVSGAVSLFSPAAAARYRVARDCYRAYSYQAAAPSGPNSQWRPRRQPADVEIRREHETIVARCRDMVRNDPHVRGGVRRIVDNVVRQGIRLQFRAQQKNGKPRRRLNDEVERHWRRFVRAADVSGHSTFYGLQRLILRHLWTDGGVIVHRVFSPTGVFPLQLEVIELDMLDTSLDGTESSSGNPIIRGIEMDRATGRPVAYRILASHPGGDWRLPKSRRISARDIIHVYDRDRASQHSGIPLMASVVAEMYDLSEFRANTRISSRLASAFSVFVKSQYPEMVGGENPLFGDTATDALPDYIEAGRIQRLPFGTEIQVAKSDYPGDSYEPYVDSALRAGSVGFGMSFEAFSNNYTDSSYASARSGALEERMGYQGQQGLLNDTLNAGVARWFFEALYLSGAVAMPGYAADPESYLDRVVWQNPGWAWVDPRADAQAAQVELENHITTRRNIAAQRGHDWEEIAGELAAEKELLTEYGLTTAAPVSGDDIDNEPDTGADNDGDDDADDDGYSGADRTVTPIQRMEARR